MIYSESESEPDFRFAINLVSDFDPAFKSDPESDSSLAFMNLDICAFLICIYTLLNKPADNFF